MAMKLAMKISKPNNTNGFAVFSIGFDSRTGHHEKIPMLPHRDFFIPYGNRKAGAAVFRGAGFAA